MLMPCYWNKKVPALVENQHIKELLPVIVINGRYGCYEMAAVSYLNQ